MARLQNVPPRDTIRMLQGTIDFACWKGVPYARAWPQLRESPITEGNEQQISTFGAVAKAVCMAEGSETDPARVISEGTLWTWRDVLTRAAYGTLIEWNDGPP